MYHTITVGVKCTFNEMFFQRSSLSADIFVEEQQSFRQLTVTEPLVIQQVINHSLVAAFLHQLMNTAILFLFTNFI